MLPPDPVLLELAGGPSAAAAAAAAASLPPPSLVGGKAASLARLAAMAGPAAPLKRGGRRKSGKGARGWKKNTNTNTNTDTDPNSNSNPASSSSSAAAAAAPLVPISYALTVHFFRPWLADLRRLCPAEYSAAEGGNPSPEACSSLQARCSTLSLHPTQAEALRTIRADMEGGRWAVPLAAVRSSAPSEDGVEASFAGAYGTLLGVAPDGVADAARECLKSSLDARVASYVGQSSGGPAAAAATATATATAASSSPPATHPLDFAAVVMEMVDSRIAGVAFSANPLNSDRDEMVVDASWGLGESVVDGSIEADRYVYDRGGGGMRRGRGPSSSATEVRVGTKETERRLILAPGGGVEQREVDEARRGSAVLTGEQLAEVAALVDAVEGAYGTPVDIEFAYDAPPAAGATSPPLRLRCLQARPITTLFQPDPFMMTERGEPRTLYYDFNIASEATTTTPFTSMDLELFKRMTCMFNGMGYDHDLMPSGRSHLPLFSGLTREYANLGFFFRYVKSDKLADLLLTIDPYLADLFRSTDCDEKRYRMRRLPGDVGIRRGWAILRDVPLRRMYGLMGKFARDPEKWAQKYAALAEANLRTLASLEKRGAGEGGLHQHAIDCMDALQESILLSVCAIYKNVMPVSQGLDQKRQRMDLSDEERAEYEALCGGYVGDPLMEQNIEMYRLANCLPGEVWEQYGHSDLPRLAERIEVNLAARDGGGGNLDLPPDFLDGWTRFMDHESPGYFGFDGQDQLFPSCPRYENSPILLLARLSHSAGAGVSDPSVTQKEQVAKRREAMAAQEKRAATPLRRCLRPFLLSKVRKRNAILEHNMWIRNMPKMHGARACGAIRAAAIKIEAEMVRSGELEEEGDIFHLTMTEVDLARSGGLADIKDLIRPRKEAYERALAYPECPMLFDSRGRILRPDPPKAAAEEGTLVGFAISPGVAMGRVRIIRDPAERFETGEVLATVVTGPAWTPLFVGAAAVVLQVGGVLQHGALCAREYGKPAVSNIGVMSDLKTGMLVSVDGNTGVVKILEEAPEEEEAPKEEEEGWALGGSFMCAPAFFST